MAGKQEMGTAGHCSFCAVTDGGKLAGKICLHLLLLPEPHKLQHQHILVPFEVLYFLL